VSPSFALNPNEGGKRSHPPLSSNPDYVRIGKIAKAHGLKGALKVHPYGETFTVLAPGFSILAVGKEGLEMAYTVSEAKQDNRGVLVFLSGIENRDQAESLAGAELFVEKKLLPELEDGTYYWSDIIGCEVYSKDDDYIGCVESIIPTAGNDVFVVKNGDDEVLIPALEWVVLAVDADHKTIRVDLPEGL